ncbi:hypothetical protein EB118_16970 [bacterium]|nr:hypothetical protein [Betaproteobacteria bacterium]NDA52067.1 hypothetical protein [Betaproteobacteria bacterium]NDG31748.1 hypothetical protein [bacterium]
MKKILIALSLMTAAVNAQTVVQKPVLCADLKEIIKTVTGQEHQELPIWRGAENDFGNRTVLFYNKEKTGWTIVEYRNEWGCIIGASEKSELATNVKIE